MPGIKYYSVRILQIGLAPGTAVSAISARCFHMMLDYIILNYSERSDVWKLVFQLIFKCVRYAAFYDVSMRSGSFCILGHITWILVIEISELETTVCKSGLSHQYDILLRLFWFTRLHVSSNNWSLSSN